MTLEPAEAGAVFAVELPRVVEDPPVGPAVRAATARHHRRILVVDADPAVRRTTVELLERDGHAVVAAGSAREAAWQIEQGPAFDLVISDVEMPETDGLGFYHMLRASQPETARRFVFATARYESGNWDSAPLMPNNLVHSIAQYTDIPVAPEGVYVDLASPLVFAHPFLFLTGHLPVRFTAAEAENLKAYVERGGFLFIDDHNHDIDGAFHRTVTAELARIFGPDALVELSSSSRTARPPPATS